MDEVLNSSDTLIRRYADIFTTFLYAAAIHVLIGEFVVQDARNKTLCKTALLLFIIVFLLFDWLSRVRLPHLIKEDPKVWQQLSKAFLEVAGLVFLILLAVLFVSGKQENREAYAAVFLFVSLFWNAVQIKVMKELNFWPLLKAIVSGTVVDMKAVREYADKFLGYKGRVKKEFEEANDALNQKAASAGPATRHATTLSFSGTMSITWDSFWRTFSQYVGIHLGPANFVVAIIVGVHFTTGARVLFPWAFDPTIHFSCKCFAIPLALLILPVTLIAGNFFRLHHRHGRGWAALAIGCLIVAGVIYVAAKELAGHVLIGYLSLLSVVILAPTGAFAINEITERPVFRWAGAVCSYLLWFVVCCLVPVNALLFGMACESIIVNAFLQVFTGPTGGAVKTPDAAPPPSGAATTPVTS